MRTVLLTCLPRKLLEGVPATLQDVTSSFEEEILRDSFRILPGMDDRIVSRVCWSFHNRGHSSLKLLVDYHSTINAWDSSTQWFNLHIYNSMCSQNRLFRVPLPQIHSRGSVFKELSQLPSAWFSGLGSEEGGSHSSRGALARSTNSFWSCSSHQSPPKKSGCCLNWTSRRKDTSFCLVSSLCVKDFNTIRGRVMMCGMHTQSGRQFANLAIGKKEDIWGWGIYWESFL